MKTCHVCATVCEDDAELCPLCGAELREEVSETESGQTVESTEEENLLKNPVLAVTVEDVVTADIFRDLLAENGIPFACANDGEENGSMRVMFGGSFIAEEIYVNEADLDRAKELYEQALSSEPVFEDIDFSDMESEEIR